jgi:hypothetical protein
MSAAKDKNGACLEGGKSYRLRVPANVPVKEFWSFTAYEHDAFDDRNRYQQGRCGFAPEATGEL